VRDLALQERGNAANALEAHDAFRSAALNVSFPPSRTHGRRTVPTSAPPQGYLYLCTSTEEEQVGEFFAGKRRDAPHQSVLAARTPIRD
jgi:hypothetical protein